MKALAVTALGFAGLVSASVPVTFKTSDGNTIVTYKGIQALQLSSSRSRYLFTGGVKAQFIKEAVSIEADHAMVLTGLVGGKAKVSSITGYGGVKLTNRGTKGTTRTIISSEVLYTGPTAEFKGKVTLGSANQVQKTTIVATGSGGFATFSGAGGSRGGGLSSARLAGPVDISVTQAPTQTEKTGKLHVTCSNMVYKPTATQSVLQLSGNVKLEGGSGLLAGTMSNLDRVLIYLDAVGRATRVEGSKT